LVGGFGLEVVIEQDYDRKRSGFSRKGRNLLLDAVFKYAEIIFAEIGDKIALGVFYRHRHDD